MPMRTGWMPDMTPTVVRLGYVRHMRESPPLIVTADDTTGALETAAACADAGWRCVVSTTVAASGAELVVIDLRSRHLPGDEAGSRLRSIVEDEPGLRAHKVDSTLRGNWAFEVGAIAHAGRRVLFVPAFPAAGRTCVNGTVLVDGVPVHETVFADDPRSPVGGSRPADRLPGAVAARDLGTVRVAFAEGAHIVVADATTDADVCALAAHVAAHPDVVLVGPAAVITALVRELIPDRVGTRPLRLTPRLLAVSASQHPIAAAQLAELARTGIEVVRPPEDVSDDDAAAVLARLAADVHARLAADLSISTLVVIGGDTTAAVIGEATVSVEGSLGVGIAVGSTEILGRPLRLVTKPGGFGVAGTLVDVLGDVL